MEPLRLFSASLLLGTIEMIVTSPRRGTTFPQEKNLTYHPTTYSRIVPCVGLNLIVYLFFFFSAHPERFTFRPLTTTVLNLAPLFFRTPTPWEDERPSRNENDPSPPPPPPPPSTPDVSLTETPLNVHDPRASNLTHCFDDC